jgi:hypothetical protein
MAWVFSLSAECGPTKAVASLFAQQFQQVTWNLSDGSQIQCRSTVFQDADANWWCRVIPSGVSQIGIEAPGSAYLMTELGILLYQQLRSIESYRYALVGVEVDEFRTYDELMGETPDFQIPGLVISTQLWRGLGAPQSFKSFSPNYLWQTYEGEVYRPLMVSPILKEQMEQLLCAAP